MMRTTLVLAVLGLLTATAWAVSEPGDSVIVLNGSFDGGLEPWTRQPESVRFLSVATDDGNPCCRVANRVDYWCCGPRQDVTARLVNGKPYAGRMRIRLADVDGTASLMLNLDFADGQKPQYVTLFSGPLKANQWSRVSGNGTIRWAGQLSSANIEIGISGPGRKNTEIVYDVDDIVLKHPALDGAELAALQRRAVVAYAHLEDTTRLWERVLAYQGLAVPAELRQAQDDLRRLYDDTRSLEPEYLRWCAECEVSPTTRGLGERVTALIERLQRELPVALSRVAPDAYYAWPRDLPPPRLDAKTGPNRVLCGAWGLVDGGRLLRQLDDAGLPLDYHIDPGRPRRPGLKIVQGDLYLSNCCMLPFPGAWIERNRTRTELLPHTDEGPCPMLTPPEPRAQCSLWHPEVKAEARKWVQARLAQIEQTGDTGDVLFLGTLLEASLVKNGHWIELGYSPASLDAFRVRLQTRYGTIDKLNAAWGTAYAEFDAVQPPPDFTRRTPETNVGLVHEFEQHRKDILVEWLKAYVDLADWPVACDIHLRDAAAFNGRLNRGIDSVKLYRTADLICAHQEDNALAGEIFLHSMGHYLAKPVVSWEYYSNFPEGYNSQVTDEEVLNSAARRNAWQAATWGRTCISFWSTTFKGDAEFQRRWNHSFFTLESGLNLMRHYTGGVAVMTKKLNRFSPVLLGARIRHDRVGVLQPSTASICAWPEGVVNKEGYKTTGILGAHHYAPLVVAEEFLLDGIASLDALDVLVIPYGINFPGGLSEKLLAWIEAGGHGVAFGPPGLLNENGRPLEGSLVQAAFPGLGWRYVGQGFDGSSNDTAWKWETSGNGPADAKHSEDGSVLSRDVGKGRLTVLLHMLPERELTPRLLELVQARIPLRQAQADSPDARVLLRDDAQGQAFACVQNVSTREKRDFCVTLNGRFQAVVDTDTGTPAPSEIVAETTRVRLPLYPGEATVLKLTP